jgi:uncharacterized protein
MWKTASNLPPGHRMKTVNVTITGASGFLGTRLIQKLLETGHSVHVLGRRRSPSLPPSVQFSEWPSTEVEPPAEGLAKADAVIHLLGEPVAQRWTSAVKQRIRDSRVDGTRNLVRALSMQPRRPSVLVSASAIGYYGPHGDEILTEASPPGSDFLARLTVDWEQAAQLADSLGIRVVRLRIGMVLGEGGALPKMLPPFRLGLGGKLGSGGQWISWIHIDDMINLILFAMNTAAVHGPLNATAPEPVTNARFTRQLAAALHRPAVFFVPGFVLKLALGEMANLVLTGQRVVPNASQAAGFQFQYTDLPAALAHLRL